MSLSRSAEPAAKVLAGLVAEIPHDPELAEAIRGVFVSTRRQRVFVLLREGIAAGELREDLDLELAADQLVGPIFTRLLLTGGRVTPKLAPKIVDSFFDGWVRGREPSAKFGATRLGTDLTGKDRRPRPVAFQHLEDPNVRACGRRPRRVLHQSAWSPSASAHGTGTL